ncbi:MAG: hypothetical protein FJ138_02420 [Deltaproteobacteria bacterium]|nr:hypothetical protein [Deltaproteobacteria bacterium]
MIDALMEKGSSSELQTLREGAEEEGSQEAVSARNDQIALKMNWGLLGQALHQIAPNALVLYSAAGGATLSFPEGTSHELRAWVTTWPIWVQRKLPGVHLSQAWVHIDDAGGDPIAALAARLAVARNLPYAELPQVGPIVERTTSGTAAVGYYQKPERRGKGRLVDAASREQLRFAHERPGRADEQLLTGDAPNAPRSALQLRLRKRFFPDLKDEHLLPVDHEDLAGATPGERSYLAVIHADGNRIGRHLRGLSVDEISVFSQALAKVTLHATWEACDQYLQPEEGSTFALGRPIVIGGDDLTAVVRADKAIGFVRAYLEAFERISRDLICARGLLRDSSVQTLTACAGVAFVRAGHPFKDALHLAEELCTSAKTAWRNSLSAQAGAEVSAAEGGAAEGGPSLIAFQRVTDSVAYLDQRVDRVGPEKATSERPWRRLGPYHLDGGALADDARARGFCSIEQILSAADALSSEEVASGRVRGVVDWVSRAAEGLDPIYAEREWERIEQINTDRARKRERRQEATQHGWRAARAALAEIHPDLLRGPWLNARGLRRSPWVELYELIACDVARGEARAR